MKLKPLGRDGLTILLHPAFHALLAVAGVVTAFVLWSEGSRYSPESGLDGLVGGLLVASGILLASAGARHDCRPPAGGAPPATTEG